MRGRSHCVQLLATFVVLTLAIIASSSGAAAQTETVVHSFNGNGTDGTEPLAGLISDSAGNLYGTTYLGGAYNYGTVFELSPKADGGWTEKQLHSFNNNGTDGYNPYAGLILDNSGNLYGTTENGGSYLYGTAFELIPTASGWSETVLHNFGTDTETDGWFPESGLIFDKSGRLYGATTAGGAFAGGVVFELAPTAGGTWTETTLHSFRGGLTDGNFPLSGLVIDASGKLYGTTFQGGTHGTGTAFEMVPGAGGTWTETILYNFDNGNNGSFDANSPYAGLISDSSGNLYGTGYLGGTHNSGAVFGLSPKAGGWTQTVLHSFSHTGKDGFHPEGGSLIFDTAGNLYGLTYAGGAYGYGAAFELTPKPGGGFNEKIVHSFDYNGVDGYGLYGGLIVGAAGNLYGTTGAGGSYGQGTVFEIRP